MFRFISFLILLILILTPMIWLFNNNGWINVVWLNHETKIDILTFSIGFVLLLGGLFIFYRFCYFLISLILGVLGIFKIDQLKKRDKLIDKYDVAIDLIAQYIDNSSKGEKVDAIKIQKKISSLLKNKKLKNALVNHNSKIDLLKLENGVEVVKESRFLGFFKKSI